MYEFLYKKYSLLKAKNIIPGIVGFILLGVYLYFDNIHQNNDVISPQLEDYSGISSPLIPDDRVVEGQSREEKIPTLHSLFVNTKMHFIIKDIPTDFEMKVDADKNKSHYSIGEKISFKVRSEQSCYAAVIVVQSDGRTAVLFPNRYAKPPFIRGGQETRVPAESDDMIYVEVSPPFGVDHIVLIGCTKKSELNRYINYIENHEEYLGNVTCGMPSQEDVGTITQAGVAKWATAYTVILTKEK